MVTTKTDKGDEWVAKGRTDTERDPAVTLAVRVMRDPFLHGAVTIGDMTTKRRPRAPAGLDAADRAFWRSVVNAYELSPAELVTLGQACRVTDLLARADVELMDSELVVEGSVWQLKAHPLIASTSDLRRVLDVLIRGLSLPMPDETTGHRRSPSATAAAQARWRGQRSG
jgi:hypothetical protein